MEEDVEVETIVVLEADAVIDPWAVVIKSLHTALAHRAMATATRPNCFAIWTEVGAVNFTEHFAEIDFLIFQVAR